MDTKDTMKKFNIWVETQLFEDFSEVCKKHKRSKSATIRMLMEEYIERGDMK